MRLLVVIACAVVPMALGGHLSALQRPTAVIRDSTGVRIVENPATAPIGDWRVSEAATLTIGSVDGPEATLLSGVRGVTVLSRGFIVIANTRPTSIRVFRRTGEHILSFGREGEGPGEFADHIGQVRSLSGDSIAVQDGRFNVHLYSSGGAYGRSIRGPLRSGPGPSGTFAAATHWLGGDAFLLGRSRPSAPNGQRMGVFRPSSLYSIWHGSTEREDTLGTFLNIEQFRIDPAIPPLPVPFGARARSAWGEELIFLADTRHYSIVAYTLDGRLSHIIRKQHRPVPVTARERNEAWEEIRDNPLFRVPMPADVRSALERQLERTPIPDHHQPIQDLIVDKLGFLWVRTPSRVDRHTVPWDVFSRSGVQVAAVELPRALQVLEVGPNYVIGVTRDEFDVEFVRMYDLAR